MEFTHNPDSVLSGPAETLLCPVCGTGELPVRLQEQWARCSSCGHEAATAHVAEVLSIDYYLSSAPHRREQTLKLIVAGKTSTSSKATPESFDGKKLSESSEASVQTILLTLGGFLVGLAGLFFAAVAWSALSGTAKTAFLVGVGALIAFGGYKVRQKVPVASETLTSVGAALIAIGVYAAPSFGLMPARWDGTDAHLWAAIASLILLSVCLAAAKLTLMKAWLWGAVLAVLRGAVALGLYVSEKTLTDTFFTAAIAVVTLAILVLIAFFASYPAYLGWLKWSAPISSTAKKALTVTIGALYTIAFFSAFAVYDSPVSIATYFTAALALFFLSEALNATHLVAHFPHNNIVNIIVGTFRGFSVGIYLAAILPVDELNLILVASAALFLLSSNVVPKLPTSMTAPMAVVLWIVGATLPYSVLSDVPYTTEFWLITAVTLFLAATLNRTNEPSANWSWLAWAGAFSLSVAWIIFVENQRATFTIIEQAVMPCGLAFLLGGLVWGWKTQKISQKTFYSKPVLLPGLLIAFLPGAFLTLNVDYYSVDSGVLRNVLYLFAGAVLLAVGARLKVSALVIVGAAVTLLAAVGHVFAFSNVMPRWISLAAAGALLLAAGIQWEWVHRHRTAASNWIKTMQ